MSRRHTYIQGTVPGHRYRSLTKAEMNYLLFTRSASTVSGTTNARWCNAYVDSKYGLIVLPDSFTLPTGITMTNINVDRKSSPSNSYTVAQWESLEAAGARFFTGAGVYYPTTSQYAFANTMVLIWLSTIENNNPNTLLLRNNRFEVLGYGDRMNRASVRLIDENQMGFSISATQSVGLTKGNLQYHPLGDGWRIAPNAYDQIGSANGNFSNTSYNGWIDLFSWGSSGWSGSGMAYYAPAGGYSSSNSDYYVNGDASQGLVGAYQQADWGIYNNDIIWDDINVPYAEDLVFFAPLEQGDLFDHISGEIWLPFKKSGYTDGSATWDATKRAYKFYRQGGNYGQSGTWRGLSLGLNFSTWDFTTVITVACVTNTTESTRRSLMVGGYEVNDTGTISSQYNSQLAPKAQDVAVNQTETFYKIVTVYPQGGGTGTIYVDGVATLTNTCMTINRSTAGGGTGRESLLNEQVSIGKDDNNSAQTTNVWCKDIRIYNRALSAQEVAQL